MENLTFLTGLSKSELKENLRQIMVECVINAGDLEMAQRRTKILNAIYDVI